MPARLPISLDWLDAVLAFISVDVVDGHLLLLVVSLPTCVAASTGDSGVDVDPVADGDVGDMATDCGADAGGVETENRGKLGQRKVGEPFAEVASTLFRFGTTLHALTCTRTSVARGSVDPRSPSAG